MVRNFSAELIFPQPISGHQNAGSMAGEKNWEGLMKKGQSHRHQTMPPPLPSVATQLPLDITGIPADFLTLEEFEITKILDASPLEGAIANVYSTGEVVTGFLRRAGLAQRLADTLRLDLAN